MRPPESAIPNGCRRSLRRFNKPTSFVAAALANSSGVAWWWSWSFDFIRWSRVAPRMARLGEQIVGRDRPPRSRRIKLSIAQRFLCPTFADRINDLPGGLDFIAADKKRRVAGHHIQQQSLIRFRRVGAELGVVIEMHADRAHLDARARNFSVEAEVNSFVRLKAQREGIGVKAGAALRGEQDVGGGAKLDAHLARAERQRFAGAEIEGHAGPAPI